MLSGAFDRDNDDYDEFLLALSESKTLYELRNYAVHGKFVETTYDMVREHLKMERPKWRDPADDSPIYIVRKSHWKQDGVKLFSVVDLRILGEQLAKCRVRIAHAWDELCHEALGYEEQNLTPMSELFGPS